MKEEKLTIISTDVGKAFDKIQLFLMIKSLSILGIEWNYLDIFVAMYEKSIGNIIPNGERLENFFSKIRNKKSTLVFITSI